MLWSKGVCSPLALNSLVSMDSRSPLASGPGHCPPWSLRLPHVSERGPSFSRELRAEHCQRIAVYTLETRLYECMNVCAQTRVCSSAGMTAHPKVVVVNM